MKDIGASQGDGCARALKSPIQPINPMIPTKNMMPENARAI
jgi:hypothetical protein